MTVGDALEEYLASPPIPTVLDPIKYWVGMQAAGHPLAQMALDYLSIPGSSLLLPLPLIQILTSMFSYLH